MEKKFPTTLGACVDKMYKIRSKRIGIEHKVDALRAEQKALEEHIINSFSKDKIDGARGKLASASIVRKTVPHVEDWVAVFDYVKKNDAYDLFERRLSKAAYRDRLESGEAVPGVKAFELMELSLHKVSR